MSTTPEVSEWIRSSFSGRHHDFASVCNYYFSDSDENEVSSSNGGGGMNIPTTTKFHKNLVGCFVLCGSWNGGIIKQEENSLRLFDKLLKEHHRTDTSYQTGIVQVDATDRGVAICCGDGDDDDDDDDDDVDNHLDRPQRMVPSSSSSSGPTKRCKLPCPPEELPAIFVLIRRTSMKEPEIRYLSRLSAHQILAVWRTGKQDAIPENAVVEMNQFLRSFGLGGPEQGKINGMGPTIRSFREPLRIFVSGDRMSVGKSSMCLGLLGSLVAMGYSPTRLGYIKPATQNESPQLVQLYCEKLGIECVPIGPIVYYRGFTRAFLAGVTETTDELLAKVEDAVDAVARDKDIVIIDGVGFPAVGSICGTDNASVALASSYPITNSNGEIHRKALGVLLVGGPGVGGAIDAFNLNAAFFDRARVPVLGAIFNKLSMEGFYSLENCKAQISMYFEQNYPQAQHGRKPFGFVPAFPDLGGADAIDHVYDFIRIFEEHVNMNALLEEAYAVQQRPTDGPPGGGHDHDVVIGRPAKRRRVSNTPVQTREEIEKLAATGGAPKSK